MITKEIFKAKVGREPTDDELSKCNCSIVGVPGHDYCGWCEKHDKPRFECKCIAGEVKYIHSPCCNAHWELAICDGELGLYCEKCFKPVGDRVKMELVNLAPIDSKDNNNG